MGPSSLRKSPAIHHIPFHVIITFNMRFQRKLCNSGMHKREDVGCRNGKGGQSRDAIISLEGDLDIRFTARKRTLFVTNIKPA
jgi:hypothetical protein